MTRAVPTFAAAVLVTASVLAGQPAPGTDGAHGTAPAGSGAGEGATEPGFDVTGSHPLPNATETEPPGRGACGCALSNASSSDPELAASLVVLCGCVRRRLAARRVTAS